MVASTESGFRACAADCGHRGARDRIAPTIIAHTRQKQVQCQGCDGPLTRTKVFEETYCGWNTLYMDGRSKTPDTIKADLKARADDWEPLLAWCEWCLTREELEGEVSWSEAMLQHAETDRERSHYQARIEYFRARLERHVAVQKIIKRGEVD